MAFFVRGCLEWNHVAASTSIALQSICPRDLGPSGQDQEAHHQRACARLKSRFPIVFTQCIVEIEMNQNLLATWAVLLVTILEVFKVLKAWAFGRNTGRLNVMPEGHLAGLFFHSRRQLSKTKSPKAKISFGATPWGFCGTELVIFMSLGTALPSLALQVVVWCQIGFKTAFCWGHRPFPALSSGGADLELVDQRHFASCLVINFVTSNCQIFLEDNTRSN